VIAMGYFGRPAAKGAAHTHQGRLAGLRSC
jgi:hypothetical protein